MGFAADRTSERRPERAGRFRSGSSLSSSAGTKACLSWRPGSAADKRSCQFSRAAWQHTQPAGRTSHSAVAFAALSHGCSGALRAAAGARCEAVAQVDKLRAKLAHATSVSKLQRRTCWHSCPASAAAGRAGTRRGSAAGCAAGSYDSTSNDERGQRSNITLHSSLQRVAAASSRQGGVADKADAAGTRIHACKKKRIDT